MNLRKLKKEVKTIKNKTILPVYKRYSKKPSLIPIKDSEKRRVDFRMLELTSGMLSTFPVAATK